MQDQALGEVLNSCMSVTQIANSLPTLSSRKPPDETATTSQGVMKKTRKFLFQGSGDQETASIEIQEVRWLEYPRCHVPP